MRVIRYALTMHDPATHAGLKTNKMTICNILILESVWNFSADMYAGCIILTKLQKIQK